MIPSRLEILVAGTLVPEGALILRLAEQLLDRFGFQQVDVDRLPVLDTWRAPGGDRLLSNRIVDFLIDRAHERDEERPDLHWVLAVTDADLCAPGRSFVFGEATLGGSWAVVSTARLLQENEEADEELLAHRLLTEAVHELGHLAGFDHCREPTCVMFPVESLFGVDRKGPDFCGGCGLHHSHPPRHGC